MDANEEYHDPDYAGASALVKKEPEGDHEEVRVQKIRNIVRREFARELEERANEVGVIDQRATAARRLLHRLRCSLVSGYYGTSRLQLPSAQVKEEVATQQEPWAKAEVSSLLRDGQRRLHPSVRKLLGRKQVDLEEIFKHRPPRNSTRKNYSAMVQSKNVTISADKTKSLRPGASPPPPEVKQPAEPSCSRPKKVPRRIDPKVENILSLNDATRNQQKHRFRIIIGNTSKYAAPASRADRSTHKWLLYVRGVRGPLADIVTAVTVTLHHSYAPHHIVHIDKPPYHISRRGWGEFPARVELHFAHPQRNRPAIVDHTIKLDRNYTGLQTLGAETVVDVWLYCDEKMLKYEFLEDTQPAPEVRTEALDVKTEIPEPPLDPIAEDDPNKQLDSWLEFFNKENTELDVDEMIIKSVKKEPESIEQDIASSEVKQEAIEPIDDAFMETHSQDVYGVKNDLDTLPNGELDSELTEPMLDSMPMELINQATSVKKRIMKYMEPTTGRIYYLEMDRDLDLTKVQEIVFNSKGNTKTAKISPVKPNGLKSVRKQRKRVSLLKPGVTSQLKTEVPPKTVVQSERVRASSSNYQHIGIDHCYLGAAWTNSIKFQSVPGAPEEAPVLPDLPPEPPASVAVVKTKIDVVAKSQCLYEEMCDAVKRFTCERVAVNYLLSKIPLICKEGCGSEFLRDFSFVVDSEESYWKLDFAKRRNIEWTRAKTINKILAQHSNLKPTWRTKQILLFSRLHGYNPLREDKLSSSLAPDSDDAWSSLKDLENKRKVESTIKELFPSLSDINSLTVFKREDYLTEDCAAYSIDLTEGEEEVEVVCDSPVRVKREVLPESSSQLEVLPVESEEDRLRFLFLERKCQDIGIELRNEDVGNGYSYSAVHAVLLAAMKRFAEDLIRESLAESWLEGQADRRAGDTPIPFWTSTEESARPAITPRHLWGALRQSRAPIGGAGRGATPQTHCPL